MIDRERLSKHHLNMCWPTVKTFIELEDRVEQLEKQIEGLIFDAELGLFKEEKEDAKETIKSHRGS